MEIIYDKQFWIALEANRPLLETHKKTERKIGFMVKEKIAGMFKEVSLIENIALASNEFLNVSRLGTTSPKV